MKVLLVTPPSIYQRVTHLQVHWYWINVGIKTVGNARAHAYGVVIMMKNINI